MDREVEYDNELTKINHTNYVRNSRAVMVMWGLFHIVFTILNMVIFVQPQWIGDDGDSPVAGFFGLYRHCVEIDTGGDINCHGDFLSWGSMLNKYFKATSTMVAISCLLCVIVLMFFLLFCLLNTATVLKVSGWFQFLSGMLLFMACVLFPAAWDHEEIKTVCGLQTDRYDIGVCSMRWGYFLAIVLVFDAFILSILAFVLAAKQANLLPNVYKPEDKNKIEYVTYPVTTTAVTQPRNLQLNDSYYLSEFSLSRESS